MKKMMAKMLYPCHKIRDFVFDYAEGNLNPLVSLRFQLHISMCKDCNEYVRLYRMAADIRGFRKVKPLPEELVEKTKDFLEKEGIADFSDESRSKPPME